MFNRPKAKDTEAWATYMRQVVAAYMQEEIANEIATKRTQAKSSDVDDQIMIEQVVKERIDSMSEKELVLYYYSHQ